MVVPPLPSSYITLFVFGFLKSVDLKLVGLRFDSTFVHKQEAPKQVPEQGADIDEKDKKEKRAPAEKYEHFFGRQWFGVRWSKFHTFKNRGFEVFLEKLEGQQLVRSYKHSKRLFCSGVGYVLCYLLCLRSLGFLCRRMWVFQVSDEIGSSTLVGCGFTVTKDSSTGSEQVSQTPFGLVPRSVSLSNTHTIDTSVLDQILLKGEISVVREKRLSMQNVMRIFEVPFVPSRPNSHPHHPLPNLFLPPISNIDIF